VLYLCRVQEFLVLQLIYDVRRKHGRRPYWPGAHWGHGADGHREWLAGDDRRSDDRPTRRLDSTGPGGLRTSVLGHQPFVVRRRRAGRPQRSEDRTGPATSGGGRRPHLTRERKVLTLCGDVLCIVGCRCGLSTVPASMLVCRVGIFLEAQGLPYPMGQGSA
jgi:hypothetical protein